MRNFFPQIIIAVTIARMSSRVSFVPSVFHISVASDKSTYNVTHSDEYVNSKYNILRINASPLKNKLDDLELFIHRLENEKEIKICIIVITDIKINKEQSKYYNLPSYNAYFSINENGGVALYIHKNLTSGLININPDDGDINSLIANIPDLKINVGVLHKLPYVSVSSLTEYYSSILKGNQKTILFADTYINLLNTNASSTTQYMNAVKDHNFSILNNLNATSATRQVVRRTNKELTLNPVITDHVLSNVQKFKYSMALCYLPDAHWDLSDHKITILGFDDNRPDNIPLEVESATIKYNRINYRFYNRHFANIDFRRINSIDALVCKLKECKQLSLQVVERPRTIRTRPWISEDSLNKLGRFYRRQECYAEMIRQCRDSPKKLWNTISGFLVNKPFTKQTVDAIYNKTNQIVTSKPDIANILNKYFLDIGKVLHDRIPNYVEERCSLPKIEYNQYSIEIVIVTDQEVYNKIQQMKNNNNIRDPIPTATLKHHAKRFAPNLAKLFNRNSANGYFPDELKVDRIVPAFKKNDPLEPKNYRPISVPPNLSKIFESLICDKITEFCRQHDIFNKNQYGFQKGSSSLSAVISVVRYLQIGLSGCPSGIGAGLFIDLKKASNTIPHKLFLEKLDCIGIRGRLHNMIGGYLRKRRQYVDIDNNFSELAENPHEFSIPQGSALGPLFFLLYINDIFNLKLNGKLILYADDTAIVYFESDPNELKRKMDIDVKLLNKWFTKNKLTLNPIKTKAMIFSKRREYNELDLDLIIRNKKIDFVKTHTYLGIELQNDLKFNEQIFKIARELHAASDATKKIGTDDRHVAYTMYHKLVFNKLLPMAMIYGSSATEHELNYLQEAQDIAVKSIFSGERCKTMDDYYMKYKLLRVRQIIKYDRALLIYKLEHKLLKLDRSVDMRYWYNSDKTVVVSSVENYFYSLPESLRGESDELVTFKKKLKNRFFPN